MDKNSVITGEEFARRRRQVFEKMPPMSIAVLPSSSLIFRNNDTEFPFRQNSHFYYLTGFKEPNSCLMLRKSKEGKQEFILFCQDNITLQAIWVGARAGKEGAVKEFGADRAFSFQDLEEKAPELMEDSQQIFYTLGTDPSWDARVTNWVNKVKTKARTGVVAPDTWVDFAALIAEMRLIKTSAEIKLMREAATISAHAHRELISNCKPNKVEYELEALFLHECYKKGCRSMAYSSIVGGGNNACTLHYVENNKTLHSGDLVLVDAGGEYQYYASDITRTYPINGKFTEDQKSIYALVLKAKFASISWVKNVARWDKLQEVIVQVLVEGLVQLGILKGNVKELILEQAYRQFYMHNSGHWLGLDVHDVGEYKLNGEYIKLEPGMVLTVEPGLYIAEGNKAVDKRWWGIGVRIEDDILVTNEGCEVLSKDAPKTIEAIEQLMLSNR